MGAGLLGSGLVQVKRKADVKPLEYPRSGDLENK
jgi:hypothetical protein